MPAGSDSSVPPPALPVRFRPLGVRVAAAVFGIALVATMVAVWETIDDQARASFTPFQRATILVICLVVAVLVHALTRCRVDADEGGVTVVNGYRTHRFTWTQIVAVTLRPGSPWAELDLSDGTTTAAMGIQGSDGTRARRQTRVLRRLVEEHAGHEPDRPPPPEPSDG